MCKKFDKGCFIVFLLTFFFSFQECKKSDYSLENETNEIKRILLNVTADLPIYPEDKKEELKYYRRVTYATRGDKLVELLDIPNMNSYESE